MNTVDGEQKNDEVALMFEKFAQWTPTVLPLYSIFLFASLFMLLPFLIFFLIFHYLDNLYMMLREIDLISLHKLASGFRCFILSF